MSDFNFVGAEYQAASPTQDCQMLVNWYPENDPTKADIPTTQENEAQRGVLALYPTPGLVTKLQLAVGEVRGMWVLPGGATLLVAAGATLYSVTSAYVATSVGTLLTTSGPVYIRDNGSAAYLTDGQYRYSYVWATGTFTQQSDGAFSGGGVCDEVDNFFIYSNPATNQWGCSDVGAIASNALNLGAMLGASGNLVALVADHRQVLLLGERYSERWINVGTFPFPFAIIPGSSMQHGCGAPGSVARLGEGVAFLALDTRGQATVVAWGASLPSPQRISTFAIENAIQGYAVTSDAVAYTYSQAGHEFYVLTFPTADVTWVYDLATQLWHRRAWRDPATGLYHRHRSNCAAVFGDAVLVGDYANGKVYELSQTVYTDAGAPLPCVRRCRHLTSDLKRQYFHDLQIQFQPGVGTQAGGQNYLSLNGNAGSYASTPSAAANQITGDIELIGYAAPLDWTPAISELFVSKDDQAIAYAYQVVLNTNGTISFSSSANGVATILSTSTVATGAADGAGIWWRVTCDVDNGAGGNTVKFYTSTDPANTVQTSVTWTQLGATITNAGTTSIFASTVQVEIVAQQSGTAKMFNGKIYSTYIYNGLVANGGTLAVSFVANDAPAGSLAFDSTLTGAAWTVHAPAAIAGQGGGAVADPQALLRWSNDGGFTFGPDRVLKIGAAGKYRARAIKRRLGWARDRVYEVVVTDPVYRVIVSANLNASAGAN